MLEVSFSLEGGEVVHRRLGLAIDGTTNLKPAFAQIGKNFMKTFDMNFSSRGATYGGWAPRKPQYRGGRRVDTWPLLEKTGRMRKSFYQTTSARSLELGNTAKYFVYHQSSAPRTVLPRRAMMKIRRQDADMITKELQHHLRDHLQGRRF